MALFKVSIFCRFWQNCAFRGLVPRRRILDPLFIMFPLLISADHNNDDVHVLNGVFANKALLFKLFTVGRHNDVTTTQPTPISDVSHVKTHLKDELGLFGHGFTDSSTFVRKTPFSRIKGTVTEVKNKVTQKSQNHSEISQSEITKSVSNHSH